MSETQALYLNVVDPLNSEYHDLLGKLKRMDTRNFYLKTFEVTLSASMSKNSLWADEKYKEYLKCHEELPDDPYSLLPYETFRSWLTVYEMIMRDHGLIGIQTKEDRPIMGLGQYRRLTDG